jgi:hypothetical protein
MTTITFERSGGVVGQEIFLDLDLDTLPSSESLNLIQLLQRANFFKLPRNLEAKSTPDEFQYRVTVDSGSTHHSIRTSDTTAPESLRPLLNILSTIAQVA